MFIFYHREQNIQNASYHKGKLFEQLIQQYLQTMGYELTLRRKHNSLEYDLDGVSRLDNRTLIGEAKAYSGSVPAHELAAFVGKCLPRQKANSNTIALFLATSQLTPEAEDYQSTITPDMINLKVQSGNFLLQEIARQLELPTVATARHITTGLSLFPLSVHLLVTDVGPYILQIAAAESGATPASFILIRRDSQVISDQSFLDSLRQQVPELQELQPAHDKADIGSTRSNVRPSLSEGLILGNDWVDYRLPARPAYFIGRRQLAERIVKIVLSDDQPGVLQVKSRSGVGKSSLMAFLAEELSRLATKTHLYDARSLKSVLDVWAIVQRFTGTVNPAADLGEMERHIHDYAARLDGSSVLLLDQFESTFIDADLFDAVEALIMSFVKSRPGLCIIIARKNDLVTTYDERRVSLDRINEVSSSILLEDFSPLEAVELIDAISQSTGRRVLPEVKSYVLEFAKGFPWLLKRTMAHILKMSIGNRVYMELLSASLRLDDLFDEEIEELDEIERDYLLRIARHLPSTLHQLDSYFDEDPLLHRVLDKLTRERLLRLEGSTYDTYNDVFKEYLLYRRLPEFRLSFVYRIGPTAVVSAFRKIREERRLTTDQMSESLRKARGSTFNLIREMRHLGLLDRDAAGVWTIPEPAFEAYERIRLGEYIREQLMRNGLIADLLRHLQAVSSVSRVGLTSYLQEQFPFVDASDRTWSKLAAHLLSWLGFVELVSIDGDTVRLKSGDRSEAAQRIGNLRQPRTTHKIPPAAFLPGVRWTYVVAVMRLVRGGNASYLDAKQKGALLDLQRLNCVSASGQMLSEVDDFATDKIRTVLEGEPYRSFWDAVHAGSSPTDTLARIFGVGQLAPSTIKWRARLLIDWGVKLNVISRPKKSVWKVSDPDQGKSESQSTLKINKLKRKSNNNQIMLFPELDGN